MDNLLLCHSNLLFEYMTEYEIYNFIEDQKNIESIIKIEYNINDFCLLSLPLESFNIICDYLNITDKCVNHINDEESCDLESNEIVNVNDPTIINKTVVLKTGSTLIISNNLTIVENLTVSDGSTIEISTKSNDFTTISIGGCFTPKGELIITNDFTNNELIEDTVIDLFEYQCLSSNSTFNNVTIRDPNDPDKLIIIDDMDKDECISIEYTQSVMQLLMVGCNVDNNNNNNVTEVDSVTMVMIYIIGCMFLVIIGVTISMYFCRKRIFPYRYRATFKLDETEIPTSG